MSPSDTDAVCPRSLLGRFSRRLFLQGFLGVGVLGGSPLSAPVRAAIPGVTVDFDRCSTAFVTNASAVETLTVYYARRFGARKAQYDVPAGLDLGDLYGYSVALSDETLAIGDDDRGTDAGAVYVFER